MFHQCNQEIIERWTRGLEIVESKHIYKFKDYSECIFDTQVQSKNWLGHCLQSNGVEPKRVSVLASWYGVVIVPMLRSRFPDIIIDLYDVDEYTMDIADYIWSDDKDVNVYCKDVVFDNVEFKGDLIVNCSCEHMYDMSDIVNEYRGRTFAFQSNDNRNVKWLHINCVDTPEELQKQADIQEVIYAGKIQVHRNNRIMVIGK